MQGIELRLTQVLQRFAVIDQTHFVLQRVVFVEQRFDLGFGGGQLTNELSVFGQQLK